MRLKWFGLTEPELNVSYLLPLHSVFRVSSAADLRRLATDRSRAFKTTALGNSCSKPIKMSNMCVLSQEGAEEDGEAAAGGRCGGGGGREGPAAEEETQDE